MSAHPIHHYGHPVLRTKGEAVREFGPSLRMLGNTMLEAMRAAKGIGLAAPQIGLSLQLFVIDICDDEYQPTYDGKKVDAQTIMPLLLANAKVRTPEGPSEIYTEGCLSFPGIMGDVNRVEQAVVRFHDADGTAHTLECEGLLARCVHHEHDHCQGVLFIDRMSRAHQLLVASKVKKLQRATQAELKAAKKKG